LLLTVGKRKIAGLANLVQQIHQIRWKTVKLEKLDRLINRLSLRVAPSQIYTPERS
jgi:hypothetical protein